MASIPQPDPYVLSRDIYATTRLNCQHYLWGRELGYNIHPSIKLPQSGVRIADVATGTGVWLLEVASQYPQALLDGSDISLAQAPPQKWCPKNVFFSIWDFFQEPPEEWCGIYDVVHLRLVLLVIQEDPRAVIRNMRKLLKAGGCLQWEELDLGHMLIDTVGENVSTRTMEMMAELMKSKDGLQWLSRLPVLLGEEGFEKIEVQRVKPDMALLRSYSACHLLVWPEIASSLPAESPKKRRFDNMIEGLAEETRQGAVFGIAKTIVLARKPGYDH